MYTHWKTTPLVGYTELLNNNKTIRLIIRAMQVSWLNLCLLPGAYALIYSKSPLLVSSPLTRHSGWSPSAHSGRNAALLFSTRDDTEMNSLQQSNMANIRAQRAAFEEAQQTPSAAESTNSPTTTRSSQTSSSPPSPYSAFPSSLLPSAQAILSGVSLEALPPALPSSPPPVPAAVVGAYERYWSGLLSLELAKAMGDVQVLTHV
jgi:hypothetical protein